MFITLIFLIVIAVVCIFIPGHFMSNMIQLKGYDPSTIHPYLLTIFLGLFGVLYMISLPDLKARKQRDDILRALSNTSNLSHTKQEYTTNNSVSGNTADFFCKRCGSRLSQNSLFCEKCGQQVNKGQNDVPNNPLSSISYSNVKHCPHCGETVNSSTCEMCGKSNNLFD